jgi:hypothetical protein
VLKLSIIVPADGHQEDLDNTLLSVLENRPAHCQVMVPHPSTYRDPYDLGDEVKFVPTESAELATLINAAVQCSDGEVIHVLLGRSVAQPGWTEAVMQQFADEPETAAIAPAIAFPGRSRRLTAVGIRYGRGGLKRLVVTRRPLRAASVSRWRIDGPLLQAAFIRRNVLDRLGGLRGEFGRYHIDTDLAARLRAAGARCVHQPESHVQAAFVMAPRGFHAARREERLFWTHLTPLSRRGAHACHMAHVSLDLVRHIPRLSLLTSLVGRTFGAAESVSRLCCGPRALDSEFAGDGDATISIPIDQARRAGAQTAGASSRRHRYTRTA